MDYFGQSYFGQSYFDAGMFGGASVPEASDATVVTTWIFDGVPFANESVDYIVKAGTNEIIATGTATTNGSGVLSISVPGSYLGQKLVVQWENVAADGATSGRFHGTQVVVAT